MKELNLTILALALLTMPMLFAQVQNITTPIQVNNTNGSMFNYLEWDNDSTDGLSEIEFYHGTFKELDLNKDQLLTEDEWKNGDKDFKDKLSADDFKSFDMDNNGSLSIEEFNSGILKSDFYNGYDFNADGNIDELEFGRISPKTKY